MARRTRSTRSIASRRRFARRSAWPAFAIAALLPLSIAGAQTSEGQEEHLDRSKAATTSKPSGDDANNEKEEYLKPFPVGPQEAYFHENLSGDYRVRRTDHFVIFYNTKDERVEDLLLRLEATYRSVHRFATRLEINIKYPKEKLAVVFCSTLREYQKLCKQFANVDMPDDGAGIFCSRHNCAIFFDMSQTLANKERFERADRLREQAKNSKDPAERKRLVREAQTIRNRVDVYWRDRNRGLVQHEVAHQLLCNFGVQPLGKPMPAWFSEGLATQFEPTPGKTGAGFNVLDQHRLGVLRRKFKKEPPDLRDFVANPYRSAVGMTHDGYALSWGLLRYLIKRRPKEFPKYVELLNSRKFGERITPEREIADFEQCFGKLDADFTKKWHAYIMGLPYRPQR